MSEREEFEKVKHDCILETECLLGCDEDTFNDISHYIWQAATKQSEARIKELDKQALRYEFVRKLTPEQFAEIYAINIKTGVHFDNLIDQEIIETL